MKKYLFLLLCLLIMFSLSACHIYIDTDPWPASPDIAATEGPLVTVVPPESTVDTQPVLSPAPTLDDEAADHQS